VDFHEGYVLSMFSQHVSFVVYVHLSTSNGA